MEVKIINKSSNDLPVYETEGSVGMDVKAYFNEEKLVELVEKEVKGVSVFPDGIVGLAAGQRMLVPTGLYVSIPQGYEIQVRPRSGLAIKAGVTVLNTPGTIDSDYRGEIGVILMNTTKDESFMFKSGDRIAQIVLKKVERIEWTPVSILAATARAEGGFGSTGSN